MNALARTASATVPRAAIVQRRMMSGASAGMPGKAQPSFAETWFKDPATYPIIGVLCIAVTGSALFIGYKVTCCPDIRVTGKTKNHVIRTW